MEQCGLIENIMHRSRSSSDFRLQQGKEAAEQGSTSKKMYKNSRRLENRKVLLQNKTVTKRRTMRVAEGMLVHMPYT